MKILLLLALFPGFVQAQTIRAVMEGKPASNDTIIVSTSTKRVGVANASPAYPLDVTGDIRATGFYRGNGSLLTGLPVTSTAAIAAQLGAHEAYITTATKRSDAFEAFKSTGAPQVGAASVYIATATQRADAFEAFKATAAPQIGASSAFASTMTQRSDAFEAFKSTASSAIGAHTAFVSTATSRLDAFLSFASTATSRLDADRAFISTMTQRSDAFEAFKSTGAPQIGASTAFISTATGRLDAASAALSTAIYTTGGQTINNSLNISGSLSAIGITGSSLTVNPGANNGYIELDAGATKSNYLYFKQGGNTVASIYRTHTPSLFRIEGNASDMDGMQFNTFSSYGFSSSDSDGRTFNDLSLAGSSVSVNQSFVDTSHTFSVAGTAKISGATDMTGPLTLSGSSLTIRGNEEIVGGVDTFPVLKLRNRNAISNFNSDNYFYSGGTAFNVLNQAGNVNLMTITDAGAVTIPGSSFSVGGSTFTIASGNATIGYGAPGTARLVINTENKNIPALGISNWYGGATSYGPRIQFDNSTQSSWSIGGTDGGTGFDLAYTWGTPIIRAMPNGNVGISTSAPSISLDVQGQIGPKFYTLAQMNVLVPGRAGAMISISDASAPYSYCISTGTAAGAWVQMHSPTTHCQ